MVSPERRKGSAWELEIVRFLTEHGFPKAERAYGAGRPLDVGDIDGIPGVVIEAKNHKTMDLAGWCDEADSERVFASADLGIVVAKRRRKSVEHAYGILPFHQLAYLLKKAGY